MRETLLGQRHPVECMRDREPDGLASAHARPVALLQAVAEQRGKANDTRFDLGRREPEILEILELRRQIGGKVVSEDLRRSEAIRGDPRRSEAISVDQRPSEAIMDN